MKNKNTPLSLKEAIHIQANKEIFLFIIFIHILMVSFFSFFIYSKYVFFNNHLSEVMLPGIEHDNINGDFFDIHAKIYNLVGKNDYSAVWFTDANHQVITDVYPGDKSVEKIISNKDFSFQIHWNRISLQRVYPVGYNDGFLYLHQNFYFIPYVIIYVFIISFMLLVSNLVKRNRLKTYEKFIDPVICLKNYINNNDDNLEYKDNSYTETISLFESVKNFIFQQKEHEKDKIKISELSAIVQTIQMIAHDVRKPFAFLSSSLYLVKQINDVAVIKDKLQQVENDLKFRINKINGMLFELMSFNKKELSASEVLKSTSTLFSSDIKTVLFHALKLCFISKNVDNISFEHNFQHNYKINISDTRLDRIFVNLIGNAIDAMKNGGKLWFHSKHLSSNFTEIKIGNSNSYIPEDDLKNLFSIGYSKGKDKGIGLGLFIVKKFIEDAGGEITCQSSKEENFVEFTFIIPNFIEEKESEQSIISRYFEEFVEEFINKTPVSIVKPNTIQDVKKNLKRIVVVDDDESVHDMWKSAMVDAEVITFKYPQHFVRHFQNEKNFLSSIECIILDYYYQGTNNIIEMNFIDTLRRYGYKNPCFLSSDHFPDDDEGTFFDGFLPKEPITFNGIKNIFPNKFS